MELSEEQIQRYSRHIILPQIGGKGQEKLLDSKILCIGAGGLGSPAAYYLAASGTGTIGILDSDNVEISNLHRQILHFTDDLGSPKTDSAKDKLKRLNPDCNIITHSQRLEEVNAHRIISDYDIVVDGSDNFPTRYLVNDTCYRLGKPLVSGAIFQFEGQITTFRYGTGQPCLRCLYPEPPPAGEFPSCQESGILGAVGGIIGSIQALEAIKELVGIGDTLAGRLVTFDALKMSFSEMSIRKLSECVLCGHNTVISEQSSTGIQCTG